LALLTIKKKHPGDRLQFVVRITQVVLFNPFPFVSPWMNSGGFAFGQILLDKVKQRSIIPWR